MVIMFLIRNVQISYDASGAEGGGLVNLSVYRPMGKGGIWSKRHITFYSG